MYNECLGLCGDFTKRIIEEPRTFGLSLCGTSQFFHFCLLFFALSCNGLVVEVNRGGYLPRREGNIEYHSSLTLTL